MQVLVLSLVVAGSVVPSEDAEVMRSGSGGHVIGIHSGDSGHLGLTYDRDPTAGWEAFVGTFVESYFPNRTLRYLLVDQRDTVDGGLIVTADRATQSDAAYLHSQATFIFDSAGLLTSFVGVVLDVAPECGITPEALLENAVSTVSEATGVAATDLFNSVEASERWSVAKPRGLGTRATFVMDEVDEVCGWLIDVDAERFFVRGDGVVAVEARRDEYSTGIMDIRRRTFPVSTSVDHEDANGTVVTTASAGYNPDFWGTNCTWELSYFVGNHKLDQVWDDNGAECTDVIPCGSSTRFACTGDNGDALREQTAWFYVRQANTHASTYGWTVHAPAQTTSAVRVVVDAASTSCSGVACYDGDWTDIYLEEDNTAADEGTVLHEYGHHVVWTYGDLANGCNEGVDESNGLDETVANVFAYAVSTSLDNLDYNTMWGRVANGGRHLGSSSILSYPGDHSCAQDVHDRGVLFEQAAWELIHNINCSVEVCSTGITGGNSVWGNGVTSITAARYTLDALAYALDTTGSTATYEQFAAQMAVRAGQRFGLGVREDVEAVFAHHGLN